MGVISINMVFRIVGMGDYQRNDLKERREGWKQNMVNSNI